MIFKYEVEIEDPDNLSPDEVKDRIEEALRNEGLETAVRSVVLVAEYD